MFYDDDADLNLLQGKTVAILGYGSQGPAHSLNLKDSGVDVVVGLRPDSSSVAKAREQGLEVTDIADAASRGDVVMVLLPDERHHDVWEESIRDGIAPGNTLLFGHGFSIHYGEIEPPPEVNVALIAPKGPGHLVRRQFLEGSGVPGLVAVHADPSGNTLNLALAYAKGIGCTRGGVIETTFKDETETDLFGEQAVLCGGVSELVQAGYDTLVEAGYDPKVAFFEGLHELKLIVDLMYEKGLTGMRFSVSNTAEYGDYTRGKRVISDATRKAMKEVLGEIQSGAFAREWIAENRAGQENFKRMREEQAGHQIERDPVRHQQGRHPPDDPHARRRRRRPRHHRQRRQPRSGRHRLAGPRAQAAPRGPLPSRALGPADRHRARRRLAPLARERVDDRRGAECGGRVPALAVTARIRAMADEPTSSDWLPPRAPGGEPPPRFEPAPPEPEPEPEPAVPRARPVQQRSTQSNGLAVTALVLGIIGLTLLVITLGLAFVFTLPCSIAAWIFSAQARARIAVGETAAGRGQAHAAYILGV